MNTAWKRVYPALVFELHEKGGLDLPAARRSVPCPAGDCEGIAVRDIVGEGPSLTPDEAVLRRHRPPNVGARVACKVGGCRPPAASPLPPRILETRRSGGHPVGRGRTVRSDNVGGAGMRTPLHSPPSGAARIAAVVAAANPRSAR